MKASISLAAAVLVVSSASPAPAQDGNRLARGDISATAGRLIVNIAEFDSYDDWRGQGVFTAGVGWYWTDHLKTEVEIGASTNARTYGAVPIAIGGQQYIAPTEIRFSSTRIALLQRYQFGRNEWFHPSLGAGLDLVSRSHRLRQDPIHVYDPVTRQSRQLRSAVPGNRQRDTEVRALAVGGFKAYLTPRSFVLADMRVTFAGRPDDVLLRVGLGVDF